MEALQMACQMLGLKVTQKKNYTWFNRHVGDYPVPAGVKVEELGRNAEFVIGLGDEKKKRHPDAYEIGMVADPNNEGCYVPIYDFWAGGKGLDQTIGSPLFNDAGHKSVKMLCPKLKQMYDMCCDKLAAVAVGDQIEFLTAKQAHEKYPAYFPASTDEETWVSISNTDQRVQETNPIVM
jgi:hypothetical protein